MKKMLSVWLCFLLAFAVMAVASGGSGGALAKDLSITVPDVIQINGGIESSLPIEINPKEAVPRQAMVLIRGLSTAASLTDGRLFPSGVWGVKPSSLGETRVITHADTAEKMNLSISLVTLEGDYLSTASARLIVTPNSLTPPPQVPVAAVANAPDGIALRRSGFGREKSEGAERSAAPPPRPMAEAEKILKLMERGDRYMVEGKIDFARRFYQLVAEMGAPEGAEAVARTYDPNYLRRFPIVGGIDPSTTIAQQWYNKAKDLRASLDNINQGKVSGN